MKEVSKTGHFTIDLPSSDAATALSGPGNYINRGEICAVIIELDPVTFVAEVPEAEIKTIVKGQTVSIQLVTGEVIKSRLSFVSKSATPSTRSFRVEAIKWNFWW